MLSQQEHNVVVTALGTFDRILSEIARIRPVLETIAAQDAAPASAAYEHHIEAQQATPPIAPPAPSAMQEEPADDDWSESAIEWRFSQNMK